MCYRTEFQHSKVYRGVALRSNGMAPTRRPLMPGRAVVRLKNIGDFMNINLGPTPLTGLLVRERFTLDKVNKDGRTGGTGWSSRSFK